MKKGIISTMLLFMTIVYLGYAGFALMSAETLNGSVGKGAKENLDLYSSVNKLKLSLNQYAKYALMDSIITLFETMSTNIWCGDIDLKPEDPSTLNFVKEKYVVIEYRGKDCYQDDVIEVWNDLFNKEINKYLESPLKEDNFKIEKIDDNYIAVMKEKITINENNINYNFTYNLSLNINLDNFIKLISELKTNSNKCGSDIDCWETKSYEGYIIDVSNDGNLFMFEATSNERIKSFYGEKRVILYFAIDYESELI